MEEPVAAEAIFAAEEPAPAQEAEVVEAPSAVVEPEFVAAAAPAAEHTAVEERAAAQEPAEEPAPADESADDVPVTWESDPIEVADAAAFISGPVTAQAPAEAGEEPAVFTEFEGEPAGVDAAEPEGLGLPGWVAPPSEPPPEGAGWLGQALAETTALSHGDVEVLGAAGIDPHDGVGALRLLAGLLRVLERRQVLSVGELAEDLRAQRESAAAPFSTEAHDGAAEVAAEAQQVDEAPAPEEPHPGGEPAEDPQAG